LLATAAGGTCEMSRSADGASTIRLVCPILG
jgi:hypothetical protein